MGDEAVQAMDFDAQGMHFWLLCISWQRNPPCSIPNDQAQLRRWLRNPPDPVWNRVWPQIKKSWKRYRKCLVNFGLMREYKKCRDYANSRKQNALNRWKNQPTKHDAHALHVHSIRNALLSSSSSADVKTPTPQSGAMGLTPRAAGKNPRAQGTNPRAAGINPRAVENKKRQPGTYQEHRPPESEIMSGKDIAKVKAVLPAKAPAAVEEPKPAKVSHGSSCVCEDCFKTMTEPRA